MQYAILCYHDETITSGWSKDEDAAVMARLEAVQAPVRAAGKLVTSLRLLPTTAATTLRKDENLVIDGPFAETKEQLLGLYVVDVDGLEDALNFARSLGKANPGGAYELRPIGYLMGQGT